MQLVIRRDALELVFRTLLTCGCPITESEERQVHDIMASTPSGEAIDYARILGIFRPNANTPFHRLADFAVWQAPIGVDPHVVNREHVIRHFSSSYHWSHVVAHSLQDAYKKVRHIASWFLAHMLLPVRITGVSGDALSALYEYDAGQIRLLNLFSPGRDQPRSDEIFAVHFAGLLCRLSPAEQQAASLMLETNSLLTGFRGEVEEIDYTNFERHGNYYLLCKERHGKYYD